eukprot:TRINITY_DN1133_c0_g1_i1.p1 TRINITY_DN1133_c0_g1~~TRINITY_DN1133_c0_g1_i1.p1  ORF type:complete len:335 (-),score=73.77 TRINITY_DN1133_c0_g1_i1:34-1038(-)
MSETKKTKKTENDTSEKRQKSKKKENKEKFVEELPEEISNSEDEEKDSEVKVDQVGYLEVKRKDGKWKPHFCILIGGSFYWYKSNQDIQPDGGINLKGSKIKKLDGDSKKKWILEISNGDKTFVGAFGAAQELDPWINVLTKNSKFESTPPPEKEKGKKQGRMEAAKKKIAGKASTTGIGKSVIKKVINDETAALLISIRKIVKKEANAKKADELEKNIIKLAVKAYLLIDRNKLKGDDFLIADGPLRAAFELLIKCFNGRGRVEPKILSDAFKRVEGMLKKAETVITNLLAPHLTPKNMFRISSTFGYLANAEFLEKVFKGNYQKFYVGFRFV